MTWWTARLARGERGTSATEYALIITGIAVAMVAVVGMFHETISQMWADVIDLM